MKTAREWFAELPEPQRSEAIANIARPNSAYSNLCSALISNFRWLKTPQGYDYWDKFYNEQLRLMQETAMPTKNQ